MGTLDANSASTYAANVRIDDADLSIARGDGLVLKDERLVEDDDEPTAAYYEGFFNTAIVLGATPEALTKLEAKVVSSSEFRLI